MRYSFKIKDKVLLALTMMHDFTPFSPGDHIKYNHITMSTSQKLPIGITVMYFTGLN